MNNSGHRILKRQGVALFALFMVVIQYLPDAVRIWDAWMTLEEFSHGPLMLAVAIYLLWKRRSLFLFGEGNHSWLGLALTLLIAVPTYLLALKSGILSPRHYSFLLLIYGILLFVGGKQYGRFVCPSLLLMLFVIPLPNFLNSNLTWGLQLFSSDLSVSLLRAIGISVFQDGNVIDLGLQKLEVAEACAGLRYLYPMVGLGILTGMLFDISLIKRALFLFIAAAVAIFMNVIRIFLTGVFVEVTDLSVSEGFFHLFEGWIFFIVSFSITLGLSWLVLTKQEWNSIGKGLFVVAEAEEGEKNEAVKITSSSYAVTALIIVLLIAPASHLLRNLEPVIPEREPLISFPLVIDGLRGQRKRLSQVEIDVLKMTDYFLGNYEQEGSPPISLFVGYFATQSANESPHSPRVCIPGGGWQITSIEQIKIEYDDKMQPLNRVVIKKGDFKQVVYYWFRQRGKNIAGEYEARLDLFLGSITSSRSDGSLVRLVLSVSKNESEADADERLTKFARNLYGVLPKYVPD